MNRLPRRAENPPERTAPRQQGGDRQGQGDPAVARGGARSRRRRGGAGGGQASRCAPSRAAQLVRAEIQPRLRGDRPRALRPRGSRQREGGARAGRRPRPFPRRARLWQTGRRVAPEMTMRTAYASGLLLATTLLLRPAAARADAPLEAGRVYVASDGITIAVVPLKPRTDNKALVRVTGSGTPFDDKVILHERNDDGGGKVQYVDDGARSLPGTRSPSRRRRRRGRSRSICPGNATSRSSTTSARAPR